MPVYNDVVDSRKKYLKEAANKYGKRYTNSTTPGVVVDNTQPVTDFSQFQKVDGGVPSGWESGKNGFLQQIPGPTEPVIVGGPENDTPIYSQPSSVITPPTNTISPQNVPLETRPPIVSPEKAALNRSLFRKKTISI